jgi:hypothetical protein
MKHILTVAIAVATCHFVIAKDLSNESLTIYNSIKKRLDKKQITITEAQTLWLKHKKSYGITSKAKTFSKGGSS